MARQDRSTAMAPRSPAALLTGLLTALLVTMMVGPLLLPAVAQTSAQTSSQSSAQTSSPASTPSSSSASSTPSTVSLPAAIRSVLPDATLAGGGIYRWFGLKLYDIRLWSARKGIAPDNWDSTPFALELVYARTLYGERIAKASIDEIKQLGIGTPAQHAAWLEAMTRVFPDVAEGSQLVGVYQPGGATQFLHDGQPRGQIEDPAFGKAFFAIWLHPKTSAPKLRSALFGQKP